MDDAPSAPKKDLSAEEFLRMARGDDPNRPPMWNGPPRITTPPKLPVRSMADEGQMFEFLFSYPIHIFDDAEWPPLRIVRNGLEIHLLKPISIAVTAKEQVAAGNENSDLYCTNMRALVLKASRGFPTTHNRVFELIRHSLQWMRVLSRQYWIGSGVSGVAATYRGSAFRVEGNAVRQMNFASYGPAVLVRAFPIGLWQPLRTCVEQSVPVPVSESIFCDALSSFAGGDSVRCVVELGLAAEIELTNLLDDLAAQQPHAIGPKKYVKERRNLSFERKLLESAVWLGCADPKFYTAPETPVDWANQLVSLYKFRNKVAHEGRAVIPDGTGGVRPLAPGELQSFVFSLEVLYRWAHDQRVKLGTSTPTASLDRLRQIIAILGEPLKNSGMVLDTSESFNETTDEVTKAG